MATVNKKTKIFQSPSDRRIAPKRRTQEFVVAQDHLFVPISAAKTTSTFHHLDTRGLKFPGD
jgi:hypothetical protein